MFQDEFAKFDFGHVVDCEQLRGQVACMVLKHRSCACEKFDIVAGGY